MFRSLMILGMLFATTTPVWSQHGVAPQRPARDARPEATAVKAVMDTLNKLTFARIVAILWLVGV